MRLYKKDARVLAMSRDELDAEFKRLGIDPKEAIAAIDAATKQAIAKALPPSEFTIEGD